jgi:hypothetical protein
MSLYLYFENMASKSVWGPIVWTFFHTIAEKVKDDQFHKMLPSMLMYIKRICANLPCPDCSKHATQYISKINETQFVTKESFKIFLMNFHNSVNFRTGKPLFTVEQLNERYPRAITMVVVSNFIKVYSHRNTNIKLLINSFHKDILVKDLIKWFRENANNFNK